MQLVANEVVILLMVSAGIRIGAISKIKVKHLEPITVNTGRGIYHTYKIIVDADSRHDKYWTTCNLECVTAIKEYLEQREEDGEGPVKETSPLIRERRDSRDIFRMTKPRHVQDAAIRNCVRQILKQAGVYINDQKKQERAMSHSFRKNYKTVCESSPMKSLHVEMLMGHKEALVKSYMRPKDIDVVTDYVIHPADTLTINPNQRLEEKVQELEIGQAQEIARQNQEIATLKTQLDARKEEDLKHSEEWQALKREMDELRQFVYPGPMPHDKQMRKTYLKTVKAYYKDKKGIDVDVSNLE